MRNSRRGMTLTEIIVVIGIMLLLMALVIPAAGALWRAAMSIKHQVNPGH